MNLKLEAYKNKIISLLCDYLSFKKLVYSIMLLHMAYFGKCEQFWCGSVR